MSKTRLEYRHPAQPQPLAPSPLRQRWPILAAGGLLLVICIAVLAGPSAGLVIARLLTEGLLLALWLLAAAGFGAFLPLPSDERAASLRPITRIALGVGIIGLLQLFVGLAGAANRISGFAIVIVGVILLLVRARKLTRADIEDWLTGPADWEWLWLAALPILALAIVAAYAPPGVLWGDEPHGYDVLEYHLQLPREFYALHHIAPLHHNVFSYFPLGVEMHYLLAMELAGSPWAGMYLAQLMHLTMIALTVIAIYATARQFASTFPAMLAALAAAPVPWMALLAPVAYNEGGLLLFSTLAIGWLIHSLTLAELASIGPAGEHVRAPASTHAWIIAGVFAGVACGTKLTAVPQVLLMLPFAVAIVALIRRQPRVLRAAVAYVIAGTVVFSPWLIRNTIWTGNPVFPEAQSLLGHAHFTPEQSERWHRAHNPPPQQQPLAARLDAAQKQILFDWRYGYLLWLPAIVSLGFCFRRPQARVFAALLLLWLIFWIAFTHLQGRFFVLAIPVAALSLALWQYRWQQWEMTAVAGVLLVQFCVGCWLDYRVFNQRVVPLRTAGLLGFDDFKPMLSEEAQDLIDRPDAPTIALVGDARAFLYAVPMKRLYYRTVFDVSVKPGQTIVEAWRQDAPASAESIIDGNELYRFWQTYYAIPAPSTTQPSPPAH